MENKAFIYKNKTYKSLSEYPDTIDLEVIDAVFKTNPDLVRYYQGKEIEDPLLNKYLSSIKVLEESLNVNVEKQWVNLYNIITSRKYTMLDGRKLEITDLRDNIDIIISSEQGDRSLRLIVALEDFPYLKFKELHSKSNTKKNVKEQPLILFTISKNKDKGLINSIRNRIENFELYTPLMLSLTPSDHMFSPRIEIANGEVPRELWQKLPKISEKDPLLMEKNITAGNIIKVYDFSSHYRLVIP